MGFFKLWKIDTKGTEHTFYHWWVRGGGVTGILYWPRAAGWGCYHTPPGMTDTAKGSWAQPIGRLCFIGCWAHVHTPFYQIISPEHPPQLPSQQLPTAVGERMGGSISGWVEGGSRQEQGPSLSPTSPPSSQSPLAAGRGQSWRMYLF